VLPSLPVEPAFFAERQNGKAAKSRIMELTLHSVSCWFTRMHEGGSMLYSCQRLIGSKVAATDGDIGKISDVYFDDSAWVLRYLVVETGGWVHSREVLVSPEAIAAADEAAVLTSLSRQQIEDCPPVDEHKPVSRQYEESLSKYYGWTPYWSTTYPVGAGMCLYPGIIGSSFTVADMQTAGNPSHHVPHPESEIEQILREGLPGDAHLRSFNEVRGYHVRAKDGDIGHVQDFLVDADGWRVFAAVIDTRNWWIGRRVVVDIGWFQAVDWADRSVTVGLMRGEIEASPDFDPEIHLTPEYREDVMRYYRGLTNQQRKDQPHDYSGEAVALH
jgi:uncharacterized protein YrrD